MPAKCLRMDEDGNLPICTQTGDGSWEVSYPVTGGPGDGVPGAFGAFFVIALILGGIGTVWKVAKARELARSAGLDEGHAGTMALMSDDGLEATYLAASLRQPTPESAGRPEQPATSDQASVEERLTELQRLRDQGLVTEEEYAAARTKILGDL
jgi:hypothetical protein